MSATQLLIGAQSGAFAIGIPVIQGASASRIHVITAPSPKAENSERASLRRLSTYGHPGDGSREWFGPGEGLVGQCAVEKRIVTVRTDCVNQVGDVVVTGEASVLLDPLPAP